MTDPCHKIVIMKQDEGCSASFNENGDKGADLFLNTNCYKISILLHEMMHALGIRHTHQRADRDFYVRVWEGNIKPDKKNNFKVHRFSDTYGVPYDYQSIMHYSRSAFSRNGIFTITPTDALALFLMGKDENRLRWSDVATVNTHLDCIDNLPTTCPIEKRPYCQNGGFVLHTCQCSCPENTEGGVCVITKRTPIYDKTVQCGEVVEVDKDIQTLRAEFEEDAKVPCVFEIAPKQCYEAHIEFYKVKLPGMTCEENFIAIEYPGNLRTFCNQASVPMDKEIPIHSSKATVHFYKKTRSPGIGGFMATVTFHENTTWPRGTEMTHVTEGCNHSTSWSHFEFRTPYFPYPVACFANCLGRFDYDMNGDKTGFVRLELRHRLKHPEQLTIKDRHFVLRITHSSPESLTRVVQMPVNITFKGRDNPGMGFAIEMHKGGVGDCDGKLYYVSKRGLVITNPIFNKDNLTNCYLHIRATYGNSLHLNLKNIAGDYLSTAVWGESKFTPRREDNDDIEINAMAIMLYYEPKDERINWKLTVTLDTCYRRPDRLCNS